MRKLIIPACIALTGFSGGAFAQQSLFDQTPANPSAGFSQPDAPTAAAAEPAPAEAPKPKPKPKPRGPRPVRALTVENATSVTVTLVEISSGATTVRWPKPIAAGAKALIKLPAFKSCTASVVATFEGEGPGTPGSLDVCKEKVVRLTE